MMGNDEINWLIKRLITFKLNSFVNKRHAIAAVIRKAFTEGKLGIATYITAESYPEDYLTTVRVFHWFVDAIRTFSGCDALDVVDMASIHPSDYGTMLIMIYNPENGVVIIAESYLGGRDRPIVSLSKCF